MSKQEKTDLEKDDIQDVVKKLKVDPQKGLTSQEAQARWQKYGPNAITAKQEPMGLKFLKTLLVQLLI